MNKRTFYRVIHPSGSFSSIFAKTLKQARIEKDKWGECENGTEENKKYWKEQASKLYIEKVVEITEKVK